MHSRLPRCQTLIAEGRIAEAAGELTRILAQAQRALEPGHRHIDTARAVLDVLRQG
ncbi:hypothetical protein [Streptomyces sp. NPDC013455]|uniref:hypothetical protein n=1 Tax=Streptomyces sp. NPDC013455 TaxID=3155605 RepID=UPI0034060662